MSGELWLADVGQNAVEEVDRITAGGNYGWRCFEGTSVYNANCGPNAARSIAPIAQYNHTVGQSVTGGYVYRGTAIPALVGRYVFGDFVTGRIWHIARDTAPTLTVTTGFDSGLSIASFAQAIDGELYIVHYGGTCIAFARGRPAEGPFPPNCAATGCVLPGDATQPASGLVPYAPNAPFWSDGALKERFLALPNGTTISVGADGDFQFPLGTVLVKTFSLGSLRVETRLFMRHTDGEWAGYTRDPVPVDHLLPGRRPARGRRGLARGLSSRPRGGPSGRDHHRDRRRARVLLRRGVPPAVPGQEPRRLLRPRRHRRRLPRFLSVRRLAS